MNIDGKPMLEYIISRLKISKKITDVIIATTTSPTDNSLVDYLEKKNIPYYRGEVDDIVERFYRGALKRKADVVVRIWGDCPLVDASVIDIMLEEYHKRNADYVHNVDYPFGMNAEIYNLKVLEHLFQNVSDLFYREFPFEYVRNNNKFNVVKVKYKKNVSDLRLTIDYPQDAEIVLGIVEYFSSKQKTLNVDNIVNFYENNKQIFDKNKNLARNIEYKEAIRLRNKDKTE
jgi:spore coat polysaccharide biosynthesis protein SpsF (cytidylyltransferase family)